MKSAPGDVHDDITYDHCPSYVFTPDREDVMGTPHGIVGHPGLPYDLRDRQDSTAPYGYLCYGACGPSCKATCNDVPDATKIYRVKFKNSEQSSCRRCTYSRKMCRSHSMCRAHDECYRQADIDRFKATHDYSQGPSTFGINAFRLCDHDAVKNEISKLRPPTSLDYLSDTWKICWARYLQGIVPHDTTDCWDRTQAMYAMLEKDEALNESDPSCIDAPLYEHSEPFEAEPKIRVGTNSMGQHSPMSFQDAYAECAKGGQRMPSILELSRLERLGLLTPHQYLKCLWSATGAFDVTNGRRVFLFGGEIRSLGPDELCGTVCIGHLRR